MNKETTSRKRPDQTKESPDERGFGTGTQQAMDGREGKYLTFSLDAEQHGISILKIREIVGMMHITTVPQTPAFVKGVINLRGRVIPVVDLRLRFGMEAAEYNDRTCIVVVEIMAGERTIAVGVVVDCVSEVLNVKKEDIEDPPAFSGSIDTGYVLGMAKMEDGVKILINIDEVLCAADMAPLHEAA